MQRPKSKVVQVSFVRNFWILLVITKLAIAFLHLRSMCSLRLRVSSSVSPRYLTLWLLGIVLSEMLTQIVVHFIS